ncbi:MAG TPA: insulinase family protein [Polyangiaceae bacterium]|nr:insulinase family protein [Polyangiaceae bacterium]
MSGTWWVAHWEAFERPIAALLLAGCAGTMRPAPPAPPRAAAVEATVPPAPPPPAPPEVRSELDGAIRSGTLPNGLTYFVLRREEPVGRAALWLAVNAGSVLEDADQRGLAHFVEHMAFAGTRHYPKHALLDFIERSGMTIGPDVNGVTGFDQTLYELTLPTDLGLVPQGIDVLHDIATNVTFDPTDVERERPVILEEWRLQRGARARARDEENPLLFARSRYAEREPIGLPETVRTAPVAALERFYTDWYRPDLMGVVAVGDFDPSAVERAIVERFSDLREPDAPRPRPVLDVPLDGPTQVAVHADSDLYQSSVTVFDRTPRPRRASRDDFRAELVEDLYVRMLRERLAELADTPGSVLLRTSVTRKNLNRALGAFVYSVTPRDGKLDNALFAMLSELTRAGRYGFLPEELERASKEVRSFFEGVIEDENRAPLAGKASELVRHLFENEEVPGPVKELAAVHELLPSITLDDVNHLARVRAAGTGRVICADVLQGSKDVPTASGLEFMERAAQSSEFGPWLSTTPKGPLVVTPPATGSIVARRHDAGADADVWTLSNGVRVVLKPTAFSSGTVLIRGIQPGGTSLVGEKEYTAARYATSIVGADGAGAFGSRELGALLAGSGINLEIGLAELEQVVDGRSRADQLATLFPYLNLRLTSPRTDEMATGGWKRQRTSGFYGRTDESENRFAAAVRSASTGDHFRWRRPHSEEVDAIDASTVLALWKRLFANFRGFTFVVVGRFDPAELEPLVTTYLASLPSARGSPHFEDPHITYPAGAVEKSVTGGVENKARFWVEFARPVAYRAGLETDFEILGEVLELRLRELLREKLGGVYAFHEGATLARRPTPRGALTVEFTCAPENLERLRHAVFEELARIAREGVDDDVLATVRQRLARRDETNRRSDKWWLERLTDAYRYGDDFGKKNDLGAALARATRDGVRRTAGLLFDPRRYVLVSMTPLASPP